VLEKVESKYRLGKHVKSHGFFSEVQKEIQDSGEFSFTKPD
jgi:hypothetical protein